MFYQAAMDLSGPAAVLAVADADGRMLIDSQSPMRGREAAGLLPWMSERLEAESIAVDAIDRWTIGAGPGSFTGMRLAAALITGLAFGRKTVRLRCVPTAVAVAAQAVTAPQPGERAAVLFDGRNHELLLFEVEFQAEWQPTGIERVLNQSDAASCLAAYDGNYFAAFAYDRPPLEALLPAPGRPRVVYLQQLSGQPLLRATYQQFDNDPAQLVYIRPAVFTE